MITLFVHSEQCLGGLVDFFPEEIEDEETGYACSCGHEWAVPTRGLNRRPVTCPACGYVEWAPR
jgi:DNA-directed RNA polymerase subunit RPC12/RpoP